MDKSGACERKAHRIGPRQLQSQRALSPRHSASEARLALHNSAKASIVFLAFAEVAELVDAHDSGSCGGHLVEVRVLSSASIKIKG